MIQALSKFLTDRSIGWVALASLLVFILFGALVLPGQTAAAEKYSSGIGSPDTSLLYSPDELYRMAEAYGEAGRRAYIRARFSFDLAFPFVYGFFLTACISWLLARVLPPASLWRTLNLFPPAGVVFDLLENISTALVIGKYPSPAPIAAFLAPVFTLIKWMFVGGSFIILAVALILWIVQKTKKER